MNRGRFPVPSNPADFRHGFGLTAEVAKVLARFGYPEIMSFYDGAGFDFDRLQQVLNGFLYTDLLADKVEPWLGVAPEQLPTAEHGCTHTHASPAGAPVQFRLVAIAQAAAHAAEVLAHVFTLTHASEPYPLRDGRVRIYLTGNRSAPYAGGIK